MKNLRNNIFVFLFTGISVFWVNLQFASPQNPCTNNYTLFTNKLFDLPSELIYQILSNLDIEEIVKLHRTLKNTNPPKINNLLRAQIIERLSQRFMEFLNSPDYGKKIIKKVLAEQINKRQLCYKHNKYLTTKQNYPKAAILFEGLLHYDDQWKILFDEQIVKKKLKKAFYLFCEKHYKDEKLWRIIQKNNYSLWSLSSLLFDFELKFLTNDPLRFFRIYHPLDVLEKDPLPYGLFIPEDYINRKKKSIIKFTILLVKLFNYASVRRTIRHHANFTNRQKGCMKRSLNKLTSSQKVSCAS